MAHQQTRHRGAVKRRTTHPFKWWTTKHLKGSDDLSAENQAFVQKMAEQDKLKEPTVAVAPDDRPQWTPESRRCGLIARKIGIQPYWTKKGERGLMTLLQVIDNHVIKSFTSEEAATKNIHQNRWFGDGLGVLVVGADSSESPTKYTAEYSGLFREAGVLPKKKLARFFVTDDALLQPGTPLDARHFRVGDYVDCFGITKDHGFQGVIKRWGFAGAPDTHGTTKAHRRPGSISRGRKMSGPWRGKKMPGHMGSERRTIPGMRILRINYKHNVLYVRGPAVPGVNRSWVYVHDSKLMGK